VPSIARQSGPAARAFCVHAQSASTARDIFI
jgi:hypothetical protein